MPRTLRSMALAGAAVLVLSPATVFAATPVDNGCPAANAPISVAELGPDYGVPSFIDDPANGGNGDGWVCAFELPDKIFGGLGFTIYMFHENNLKAQGRP